MDAMTLHSTPHAGRTLLATHPLPANTLLHTCSAPYASVIYREFRKVVCAACFVHVSSGADTPPKRKYTACAPGLGVWFCSAGCMERWGREENVGGVLGRVWVAFGSAVKRMRRHGAGTEGTGPAEGVRLAGTAAQELDDAWTKAEECRRKNDVVQLDDIELEIARFAASAIVRRFIEDTMRAPPSTAHLWHAFLQLQSNECAQHLRSPHRLAAYLRVFAFLRWALPQELRGYVDSGETVRAVFARDVGNSFGIWEHGGNGERGEMFGWGIYVSASYFNHDCVPNVRKEVSGQGYMFYTTRDVEAGEELCITYLGGEGAEDSGRILRESWFFDCRCVRCLV